jgi:hypothetical protein
VRRSNFISSIAIAIGAMAAGCATTPSTQVAMSTSEDIPAARGMVTVTPTDNLNTRVEVQVEHLAPPGRVAPGATTYVVWARVPGEDRVQNLGALQVDRNLRGTLETVTPLRNFDVIITAETNATAAEPSKELLSVNVQRPGSQ